MSASARVSRSYRWTLPCSCRHVLQATDTPCATVSASHEPCDVSPTSFADGLVHWLLHSPQRSQRRWCKQCGGRQCWQPRYSTQRPAPGGDTRGGRDNSKRGPGCYTQRGTVTATTSCSEAGLFATSKQAGWFRVTCIAPQHPPNQAQCVGSRSRVFH